MEIKYQPTYLKFSHVMGPTLRTFGKFVESETATGFTFDFPQKFNWVIRYDSCRRNPFMYRCQTISVCTCRHIRCLKYSRNRAVSISEWLVACRNFNSLVWCCADCQLQRLRMPPYANSGFYDKSKGGCSLRPVKHKGKGNERVYFSLHFYIVLTHRLNVLFIIFYPNVTTTTLRSGICCRKSVCL